jgi:hypothetical protein
MRCHHPINQVIRQRITAGCDRPDSGMSTLGLFWMNARKSSGDAVVKVSKMAWFGSPTRTQLPPKSLVE